MSFVYPAHTLRVQRAFRSALKLQQNWFYSKETWYDEIPRTRAKFEAFKNASVKEAEAELSQLEELLKKYPHPDPYVVPTQEGGTKWERNTPPPQSVIDGFWAEYK